MKRITSLPRLLRRPLWLAPILLLSFAGIAGPDLVPPALRGAIIVRSVGYERGFADRSEPAVLAIVASSSGESAQDGKAMASAFAQLLEKTKIAGRTTRVVQVTHESATKTSSKLNELGAEIIYLGAGLESISNDIPTERGGHRSIVVCSHGSQVEQGCVLGVELDGNRPRLVLNLKRASAVGLRFQPELLRLARVIR